MKIFFKLLSIATIIVYIYFPRNILVFNNDEILNKILKLKNKEKIESIIMDNEIIIGSNGKIIDIKKSYINMLKENKFDINKIVYNNDKVLISKDYKIIGKITDKKIISIIIILDNNDKKLSISNLSYFASVPWYINNKEKIDGLVNVTENDIKYNFNIKYCLQDNLICSKNNFFTINKKIIKNQFYLTLKEEIKPGEIFVFDYNNELKKEINLIVKYVKSKGYEIKKIENLLNT